MPGFINASQLPIVHHEHFDARDNRQAHLQVVTRRGWHFRGDSLSEAGEIVCVGLSGLFGFLGASKRTCMRVYW